MLVRQKRSWLAHFLHGENQTTLTVAMYSILDDVYSNPSVQTFPYYTYRMLICMAKIQGKPVPANFITVAPAVLACQKQFGEAPSDPLINCIRTETFRDSHS